MLSIPNVKPKMLIGYASALYIFAPITAPIAMVKVASFGKNLIANAAIKKQRIVKIEKNKIGLMFLFYHFSLRKSN